MGEKLTSKPLVVMPPIFLAVLAVFLSLAWVIPNHTRPWLALYADGIAGAVLLIVAIWVLMRSPGKVEMVGLGLSFLLLAAVPWLQFEMGLVYSSGTAWINSFYLIGFSLAIFAGWRWEKSTPGQCLDFLFLAICLAAVVSVGMQLMQWLQFANDNFWVANGGKSRFSANMAQPNQLASLLLLGVVGVAWGYSQKSLGTIVAILLSLYLLLGVALTESRTAWLNVAIILVALYFFWGQSRPKRFNLALLGFGVYFIALHFSLPFFNRLIFGEEALHRELGDPIRLGMWKSLVNALMDRPWFGYGWGQITEAALASRDFPDTGQMTKHSHNIVLDILLYNGLVLGGLVLTVLVATFRRFFTRLTQENFILPLLAVGVVLVHAMLELPLHYAYFLLPCGMMLGVLLLRSDVKVWLACPKLMGLGVAITIACGLWITIADCLEVERTYFYVYFGKKGETIPPEFMPKLTVLTQWRDRLIFANSIPDGALTREKSRWMKGVIAATPESFLMFQLAQNLALNGRPDDAKEWLEKMCIMTPAWVTQLLAEQWESAAESHAAYRIVNWKQCHPARFASKNDLPPTE
jgi:O-antigen ligase